jgi:hypothetical protein
MAQRQEAEQRLQSMTAGCIAEIGPAHFAPVSVQQSITAKDTQVKDPLKVSWTKIYKPEDCDQLDSGVRRAIDDSSLGERVRA